jgi:phosphoribosylformimino-5-aminoimidazole carboxamide ribotide isomerase
MRIVPVLDVMGGVVVRGVGGRRHEYRPVVSPLTASCRPADVARALRDHFGFDEFYLADLDAVGGAPPAIPTYRALQDEGLRLWIDAGVRRAEEADVVAEAGANVVLGLETLAGPDVLADVCRRHPDRALFSLDLKGGEPLGAAPAWGTTDAERIAAEAVGRGARRLLVLDLARVGEGAGCGTDDLCAAVASAHPQVELWAGGGVRGAADLERLERLGVRRVLVASALHDGRISRTEAQRWS